MVTPGVASEIVTDWGAMKTPPEGLIVGDSMMVYVAVETPLFGLPVAVAMGLMVVVAVTGIVPPYSGEEVDGVVPSVV